ncbi:hypothetical protein KAJ27_04460 [bacterium]|nr:hypothetical protein [bacterium]
MSTCWQIRCCPASLYNICNAYLNKKNCWEWNKEKPCCKRMDLSRCKDCEVYKVFLATKENKEKTTICDECGVSFSYKTSRPKRCSKCRKKLSNQKQLAKYYAEKEAVKTDSVEEKKSTEKSESIETDKKIETKKIKEKTKKSVPAKKVAKPKKIAKSPDEVKEKKSRSTKKKTE